MRWLLLNFCLGPSAWHAHALFCLPGLRVRLPGLLLSLARKSSTTKPKSRMASVVLTRGAAKSHKAASALTAGNFYRGDLEKAALARVSRILASQKPKKAQAKKTRGRKAAVVVA